jgi:hypothetical protein
VKFKTLQENLRKALRARIEQGELTGMGLAEKAGFKQAHISNFLNRKRGLSVDGMDRVLGVEHLSVLDLLDLEEVNKRASIPADGVDQFENVGQVSASVAAREQSIVRMDVEEVHKYRHDFLRKLRPQIEGKRENWDRFVVLKVDAREGMSMFPRMLPGATILVDRHYNSLKPYRRNESNMYAVFRNGACTLKYVEASGKNLVLRPHNPAYPIEVIPLPTGKSASDYLIGRICHVGLET